MFGWLRKFGDRVDYQTPPAEASVIQRLAELQSRQDAALRLIDGLCGSVPSEVQDALLEVRLVLRPAVPVVPGRAEASIRRTTGRTHGDQSRRPGGRAGQDRQQRPARHLLRPDDRVLRAPVHGLHGGLQPAAGAPLRGLRRPGGRRCLAMPEPVLPRAFVVSDPGKLILVLLLCVVVLALCSGNKS